MADQSAGPRARGLVGAVRGAEMISDLRGLPGILPFMRAAFLEESGRALCRNCSRLLVRNSLLMPER